MSNAITEKPEEQRLPGSSNGPGPSVIREDEPSAARTVGMFGAALVIFGGMALAFHLYGQAVRVGPGWAVLILALGLAGLLFHAAFDRDIQFRRMYGLFSAACLVAGVLLCILPRVVEGKYLWGTNLSWGVPTVLVSLLFFLAFSRHEENPLYLQISQLAIGSVGAAFALVAFIGALFHGPFFLPIGFVLALTGLPLLVAFIGTRGISDDRAYFTALGTGGIGLVAILLVLGRSLVTSGGSSYFVSFGLVIILAGLLYLAAGAILALDWPLFVLIRRELGAFFLSPIAYLALFGFSFFAWMTYMLLLDTLTRPNAIAMEPIVRGQFLSLFPILTLLFVVPVLTMRLLSEEARTGTLEVLFTAPVDETTVVLAKFFAALIVFLVSWLPFGLVLLAIPLMGGNPFDYRPLLSFLVALTVSGAGFVAMGLLCSSLTRNQIGSGLLCFVGMLLLTFVYFAVDHPYIAEWKVSDALLHMSYVNLWYDSLQGKLVLRQLVFPLSLCVFCLFVTVKVLESRKWR